mgnify:CR=1 FL=1
MRYWLMKSEPDVYGIDDLARDGRTSWEGVRNYQARNWMRDDMKVGDQVRIEFSLRGREWRNPQGAVTYFNSLDVWKIEPARAGRSSGRRDSGDPRDMDAPPPRTDESSFGDPRIGDAEDIPF